MEYTQRLECTQRLYSTQLEKTYSEQIGFLGICGKKYPVNRGPNKLGRDPQTCNIVLNLNSISRQHAVINILNSTDFMIMDLDSANKTKLLDKTLQPYIPQPLKNGDTVQFGDVFGIFRLLEEDDDLPMTQAIDIPDTPVINRQISRVNVPVTTIPESPDVSDRDDSFILASQPKRSAEFKSPYNHFIKSCGKTVALQPIGCNKIDNIYWKSSKKSCSFNTSDSLNDSGIYQKTESVKNDRIHEMETQDLCKEVNDTRDSAYTTVKAEIISSIYDEPTQVDNCLHEAKIQLSSPSLESVDKFDSIFTANTQIPTSIHTENTQIPIDSSPSIYSMDTQVPAPELNHLPKVYEINNQNEIKFHLLTANKENHNDIFNVETQMVSLNSQNNESITHEQKIEIDTELSSKSSHHDADSNLDKSGEVILFDEIDSQQIEPEFESQVLFVSESSIKCNEIVMKSQIPNNKNENKSESTKFNENVNVRRRVSIDSNSSTDCEDIDILPTQKIPQKPLVKDGDNADILVTRVIPEKNIYEDFDILPTQLIPDEKNDYCDDENNLLQCDNSKNKSSNKSNICFEEMDTQIIEEDFITLADHEKANTSDTVNFEEMPTQVIQSIVEKHDEFNEHSTQVICNIEHDVGTPSKQKFQEETISPFKIPLQSPIKIRRKNVQNITTSRPPTPQVQKELSSTDMAVDDDKYYKATQDIYNDLYSQKEPTAVVEQTSEATLNNNVITDIPKETVVDDFLPCSIENYKVGGRFPGLENKNDEETIEKYVSNLSRQQIKEIVGIEQVQNIKKQPSDISDLESTPQKVQQIKALDIDLPSSQEIKSNIQLNTRSLITESSSDSEVENNSEEQYTPILFKENKKQKKDIKTDLREKFDTEALPTRVITRVRKPTTKLRNCDQTRNILKPRFLTEEEENFNDEIIKENICRLRSKNEKNKKDKSSDEIYVTNKNQKSKSKQDNTMKSGTSKSKEIKIEKITTKNPVSKSDQSTHSNSKDVKKTMSKKIEEYLIKENKVDGNTKETCVDRPKNDKKIDNILDTGDNLELSSKNNTTFRSTKSSRLRKNNDDKKSKMLEDGSKQSNSSKRSRRGKRSLKDDSKSKFSEKLETKRSSKSPEILPRPKRSYRKNDPDKPLVEVDTAIRRSARQKLRRENNEIQITNIEKRKSTRNPAKHEQSTVYNISSDSGGDSPRVLKRSAASDITGIRNPKRRKNPDSVNSNSSTPARTHRVLFTAFSDDEVKTKLEELGAVIVTDIMECTVLVTLKIKRTFKLLCAVGLGLPIVGYDWLQACSEKNTIVDPWPYLVQDETAEKRFMFNLRQTLTGQRNFLKGYCISSTPNAQPSAPEMKMIVECSGGVWKEGGLKWVCVSCNSDKALWPSLKRRGAEVVTTEFILTGVLRQRVDIAQNRFQ